MKTAPILAAITLNASLLLAGSAGAVQLQNLTVNGVAYTEGMRIDPSVTSLKIAGTIVTEAVDNMWVDGRTATTTRYPGVGFFAIGSDSCVVAAPVTVVTSMPDPSRCIPNWALDTGPASGGSPTGWSDPSSANFGFYLKPNFDNTKTTFAGAFEKTIPVTASTVSGAFTITYQLNSSNDAKGYSMGVLWGYTAYGLTNNFMPRVTLSFNYRPAAFASVDDGSALTAKKLNGTVTTRQLDEGKKASLFAVAALQNGQLYSRDSSGGWTLWDGTTPFKSVQSGVTLTTTQSVDILKTPTDVSGLTGTKVYVGYGVGDTDSAAYTDLLSGKYGSIYTVK